MAQFLGIRGSGPLEQAGCRDSFSAGYYTMPLRDFACRKALIVHDLTFGAIRDVTT